MGIPHNNTCVCRGGAPTKLLTFQHAIELVMVLPGQFAKETRVQFANIIRRYMAGDQTLASEIQANAQSTAPIAQAARATLDDNRNIANGIPSNDQALELERTRIYGLTNVISAMCILNSLNPTWRNDNVFVRQLEAQVRNIMVPNGGLER